MLNAADEVAVTAFLAGAAPFPTIATTIERAVDRWGTDVEPSLPEIIALDAEIRASLTTELGLEAIH